MTTKPVLALDPPSDSSRVSVKPLRFAALIVFLAAVGMVAPSVLWLLLFLGIVIVTHEGGHYLAARASGMEPTEFFWGFGPELVGVQVGSCRFGVKALFVGGYVKIEGMTATSELPEDFDEQRTYRAASHRGRLATILAGPATNLATALVVFCIAAWMSGSSFVGGFGDSWNLFSYIIESTAESLWLMATDLGGYFGAVFDTTGNTEPPVRFSSPVAQANTSGQAAAGGFAVSLIWLGILATAVGIINLLPLPPLDGSHALIAFSEGVIQKLQKSVKFIRSDRLIHLDVKKLAPLAYVTIGALLALSVTAAVLDIRELLQAA